MPSWTSTIIRGSKTFLLGVLVVVVLYFIYKFTVRTVRGLLSGPSAEKAAAGAEPQFAETDVVRFDAKVGEVTEITSDRTADAILSGVFGPAVVLVYADWCTHCRNMTDAYAAAAKASGVPFVKIQGSLAPVTGRKHAVAGYPTVFGVASAGPGVPRRYQGLRTAEAFLEFARGLAPAARALAAPAEAPQVLPAPTEVAVQPSAEAPMIATVPPQIEVLST